MTSLLSIESPRTTSLVHSVSEQPPLRPGCGHTDTPAAASRQGPRGLVRPADPRQTPGPGGRRSLTDGPAHACEPTAGARRRPHWTHLRIHPLSRPGSEGTEGGPQRRALREPASPPCGSHTQDSGVGAPGKRPGGPALATPGCVVETPSWGQLCSLSFETRVLSRDWTVIDDYILMKYNILHVTMRNF